MYNSGVYVYRTWKPGSRLRIPIVSSHFAYVGETTAFGARHIQHTQGGGRYGAVAKPWSDLEPRCVCRIQLPPWKWLLRLVETIVILMTWPVYNVAKNRWNPRRIPLKAQRMQRTWRNERIRVPYPSPLHVIAIVGAVCTVAWLVLR